MRVIVFGVGLGFAVGLGCCRVIERDDAAYQARIDEYAAYHCSMNVECGNLAPGTTYEDCFEEVSEHPFWWRGNETCMDSRWAFYDCRATVTDCEFWRTIGIGHECDELFERNAVDCLPWADED